MTITPARVFTKASLVVDGFNCSGIFTEITPPSLMLKTEEMAIGGMDQPIDWRLGMQKQTGNIKLVEPNETFIASTVGQGVVPVTMLGFYAYMTESIAYTMQTSAQFHGQTTPAMKSNESNEHEYEFTSEVYENYLNGNEVAFIDIFSAIRRINGVDQLEAMAQHLRLR